MNVLLTSAGRRVAVLHAFQRELAREGRGGAVIAADASERSAAYQAADGRFLAPRCDQPGYVDELLRVVAERRIGLLVPLIDTELPVLSRNRERLLAAGCYPAVSDPRPIEITRDKARTAEEFARLGFRTPRVFAPDELARPATLPFPVFVKPAAGSSSIGAQRLNGPEELAYHLARTRDPVVQTFEAGEEFTVDVFADDAGRACCAVPRRRWETRAGEISKGRTERDLAIIEESKALVEGLGGCRGCVTLQCFRKAGERPVFFEANLRFGGGFPLSDAAGANYTAWTLRLARGEAVAPFDAWEDGVVMLRYDEAVFVKGRNVP
jgi:carbamoyl-phosphate synthase large subunit